MRLYYVFYRCTCISVVFLLLLSSIQLAKAQEISRPWTFSGPRSIVNDFEAYLHSDGKLLVVSGKVDNVSTSIIHGYVTVYLKNSGHDVLNAIDVDLKNGDKIGKGKSGAFEAKINIEDYDQLANVSIEFVEGK